MRVDGQILVGRALPGWTPEVPSPWQIVVNSNRI